MKFLKTALFCLLAFCVMSCSEDPEESTGMIVGEVYDESDGNPLDGVNIIISSTGHSAFTDEFGDFYFKDLQPGNYSLQFTKTGYRTLNRNVDVVAGGSSGVRFGMSRIKENAEITINPSSLNFGTTQSDMNVTIKNNGNATAEWTIDLGYNNWLSVSQTGGSIQPGRTQSITFSVDRNYIAVQKTVVVNLQAFGNSFPITISCAPYNAESEMTVDPTTLNFGTDLSTQMLTIRNTGKTSLNWTVSGITSDALMVAPMSGAVAPGGSNAIQVSLDRSKINDSFIGSFVISDGINDQTISVSANGGENTSGGNDQPGGTVVTNGLAGYYQFNGTSDDNYNDYHAFESGTANYVTGVSGQAFKFSKTEKSSVIIPYGMIHGKAFSVSFWAKDISDGLLFRSNCSDNYARFTLSVSDGRLKFIAAKHPNYYEYGKTEREFTHSSISDNKWHHIVLASDFGQSAYGYWTSTLYIDGRRVGTVTEYNTYNAGESDKPNEFVVGGAVKMNSTELTCPSFTIDNLRIYDTRTLSAQDVTAIYNSQQ